MTIDLDGDAEKPAEVSRSGGDVTIPLPAASTVEVVAPTPTAPGSVKVTVSADTVLTGKMDTVTASGPRAFVPEAPPTQTELAKGDALRWGYVAGGGFLLVSLACVYFQHYKAAGFAACGAFCVPMAARFLTSDKAVLVTAVFGVVVLTLVAAWYLIDGKVDGKLSVNKRFDG